jgi:hypothetical protein
MADCPPQGLEKETSCANRDDGLTSTCTGPLGLRAASRIRQSGGAHRSGRTSSKRRLKVAAFVAWLRTTVLPIAGIAFDAFSALKLATTPATAAPLTALPPPLLHTATPSVPHHQHTPTIATSSVPMASHRFALADHGRPGSPSKRAERVAACAAYSADMLATENDYHSRGLIAIAVYEDRYHITRYAVQEAAGAWIGIPRCNVDVDFYPPKGFLLLLPTPALRDRALACNGGLPVGRAKLQLLPWSRMVGAEVAKLSFKARPFIEGLPHHARQPAMIQRLLPPDTLLEGVDRRSRNAGEASCCCIIVWVRNPEEFAN